jgi:hypothetical protein
VNIRAAVTGVATAGWNANRSFANARRKNRKNWPPVGRPFLFGGVASLPVSLKLYGNA